MQAVILVIGILLITQTVPFGNSYSGENNYPNYQILDYQNLGFAIRSADAQVSMADNITSNVNNREIAITSVSSRYDEDLGAFHVFGELNNELNSAVKNVRLNATFYDGAGAVIGTGVGQVYIDYLRPQESSAFDMTAFDDKASTLSNFSSYSISKSWDLVQESKPSFLGLDLRDIYLDPCGYYHFAGSITNSGKDTANGIIISAAFYNAKNQVTESAFTTRVGNGQFLPSGEHASFDLVVDKRVLPDFAYYSFNAQSGEYSSKVLEEPATPEGIFDYHNQLPTFAVAKGGIMTISLDSSSYRAGPNTAQVSGKFPNTDEIGQDAFVLINLMDASGKVLDTLTASLNMDGSFSRIIEFSTGASNEGQVFRVRAEYKQSVAEDNFFIGFGNLNEKCSPSGLGMSHLDLLSLVASNTTEAGIAGEKQVDAGSDLLLTINAENKINRVQQVVTIIQVFDAKGTVVFLHTDTSILYPNTTDKMTASWVPEKAGRYTVESFAITGLSEPRILSDSLGRSFSVV